MKPAPPRAGWPHPARLLLIGSIALVISGCLVIPVDHPVSSSRQNITEQTMGELKPGATTKEEVILNLGEPDRVSEDGRHLGYAWSRLRWFWLLAGSSGYSGGIATGVITRDSMLQLTFDEDSRLVKSELRKIWAGDSSLQSLVPERDQWAALESDTQGRLMLELQTRPRRPGSATPPAKTLSVAVLETIDQRADPNLVGEGFMIFGISTGKFGCSESIPAFLRQELIAEIRLMGHQVSDTRPDVTITSKLTRLWITGKMASKGGGDWEIIAEIECDLTYAATGSSRPSVTRHYAGRKVERIPLGIYQAQMMAGMVPSGVLMGTVLNGSFDDLMSKVRGDDVWRTWETTDADADARR